MSISQIVRYHKKMLKAISVRKTTMSWGPKEGRVQIVKGIIGLRA